MAIEYKTITYRTVESANDNATYCWVELSASHVPAVNGLIKRIVIQGATTSASGLTTDPMYLGIWERQDDGGLISLGCSKNTIVQAINQQNVWDFDGAIIRGKSLLLGLLSSPDEHWTNNTQLLLRSRVQTNDTDGCVILTNIGRLKVTPDITFTVEYPEYVPDAEPEEPEPEQTQRVVDISKYWIPIIRSTDEFKQIAGAENPEFNLLLGNIYNVQNEAFILESTEYGVSRWETILGIIPTENMTLDERKTQILNYLNIRRSYTIRTLRQMLAAIVGEGNFTLSLDNDTQTLYLSLAISLTQVQVTSVKALMERVVPMNLVIEMTWENGMSVTDEYYPLEYVNIVKQFTHDSVITTNALDVELDMNFQFKSYDYAQLRVISSTLCEPRLGVPRLTYYMYCYNTLGIRMCNDSDNREYFPSGTNNALNVLTGRYNHIPTTHNRRVLYHIHDCGCTINGTFYQFEPSEVLNVNWGKMKVGCGVSRGGNYLRIYRMTVKQHGETTADLVPCVRNSDGCEGLWCNVYKKFYEQSPVSTLDLDDEENGVTYFNIEEVNEND